MNVTDCTNIAFFFFSLLNLLRLGTFYVMGSTQNEFLDRALRWVLRCLAKKKYSKRERNLKNNHLNQTTWRR